MGPDTRPLLDGGPARGIAAARLGRRALITAPEGFSTPARLRRLGALLLAAMAAATLTLTSLSILASYIIDDLSITREQLGYVATVHVVLAALMSPRAGDLIDRVGARRGMIGIFAVTAVSLAMMGVAVAYWVLIAAGIVAAFADAAGNPATNKLVALHIPPGRRALVTGLKQSGVQVGIFAGGIALPLGAATIGWRQTCAIAGLLAIAAIVAVRRLLPEDRPDRDGPAPARMALPASTTWMAVYGGLLGFGGGATFFVPLFAEESVGYGARAAGMAAATIGLSAVAGRIAWARFAERDARFITALGSIAALSVVAALGFLLSTSAALFLWLAAVAAGLTASSWNSVAMLAVMHTAGGGSTGRASGRVMLGFLIGYGIAPPLYGRTIDATGAYTAMWWVSVAAFVAAAALVIAWARSAARPAADHAVPGDAAESQR